MDDKKLGSNEIGRRFEERVWEILMRLKKNHPEKVEVWRQKEISLLTDEKVRVDFAIRFPVAVGTQHICIECQDRLRNR